MPKLPTWADMGKPSDMGPQGKVPEIPVAREYYNQLAKNAEALAGIGSTIGGAIDKAEAADTKEQSIDAVNEADVAIRDYLSQKTAELSNDPNLDKEKVLGMEDDVDKFSAPYINAIKDPTVRERFSARSYNQILGATGQLHRKIAQNEDVGIVGKSFERVDKSFGIYTRDEEIARQTAAQPPDTGGDGIDPVALSRISANDAARQFEGNYLAEMSRLKPGQQMKLQERVFGDKGPVANFFRSYPMPVEDKQEILERALPESQRFWRMPVTPGPNAPGAVPGAPKPGSDQDWPAGQGPNMSRPGPGPSTGTGIPQITPEMQRSRPPRFSGALSIPATKEGGFDQASYLGATGGLNRGSMPYGTFNLSEQGTGSTIADYYRRAGLPDPGISFNLGSDKHGPIKIDDPKYGTRSEIQIHMANTNDVDKIVSSGCLAIAPDQFPTAAAHLKQFMKENPGAVLSLAPAPPGKPHEWRVLTKDEATGGNAPQFTANQAVKNLDKVDGNKDYSNATGKEITQGIYQSFRNLGYTDFGAKTMVAEIRREHGGDFAAEGGSRRPFGFEQEPANRNQVNFGFINSTGQRTREILADLDKAGLVSYDAPKTRLNPEGIRVENSQRALDVMAAWYDKDLKEKGARDPNAIINGADPRELPDLLRDENYNDVHDAHRRTAAWIQWQHPEIYGGRYKYGIAGQRHYDNMMADRQSLDRIIDQNAVTRVADSGQPMRLGGPKDEDTGAPSGFVDERDNDPANQPSEGPALPGPENAGTNGNLPNQAQGPAPSRNDGDVGALERLAARLNPRVIQTMMTANRIAVTDKNNRWSNSASLYAAQTGEDYRDPQTGLTYKEWANKARILPNQRDATLRKIEDAKLRFNTFNDIAFVGADEIQKRIEGIGGNDPETMAVREKLKEDLVKAYTKVEELRQDDPALLTQGWNYKLDNKVGAINIDKDGRAITLRNPDQRAKPHPLVQQAINDIRMDGDNGVQIVQAPDGSLVLNTSQAKSPYIRQESWNRFLSAVSAAQTDMGIPDAEQRLLTKHAAKVFLGAVPTKDMDAFEKHWIKKADQMEAMVGPLWAPRIMQELRDNFIKDQERLNRANPVIDDMIGKANKMAAGVGDYAQMPTGLDKFAQGANGNIAAGTRADDMRRLDMIGRAVNGDSMPVALDAPSIGSPTFQQFGSDRTMTVPSKLIPEGASGTSGKNATPQPNPQQIDLLKQNPDRWQDFDLKFGKGAAARALAVPKSKGWFGFGG
jgi:hypothetical protein